MNDCHDLSHVLPLNLIDPLVSQDKAIIWYLKKWLYSSPCDYFSNIVLIMSRICVLIIDELNKMLANVFARWAREIM